MGQRGASLESCTMQLRTGAAIPLYKCSSHLSSCRAAAAIRANPSAAHAATSLALVASATTARRYSKNRISRIFRIGASSGAAAPSADEGDAIGGMRRAARRASVELSSGRRAAAKNSVHCGRCDGALRIARRRGDWSERIAHSKRDSLGGAVSATRAVLDPGASGPRTLEDGVCPVGVALRACPGTPIALRVLVTGGQNGMCLAYVTPMTPMTTSSSNVIQHADANMRKTSDHKSERSKDEAVEEGCVEAAPHTAASAARATAPRGPVTDDARHDETSHRAVTF
eukprot:scaffold32330_cov30-Tisochrysis_lutea.AAC.3